MQAIVELFFKWAAEHAPEVVVSLIVTFAAPFIVGWVRGLRDEKQRDAIIAAAELAYWCVEQVARKTPTPIDDKIAEAMRMIRDQLRAPMTPTQEKIAVAALRAIHEVRVSTGDTAGGAPVTPIVTRTAPRLA